MTMRFKGHDIFHHNRVKMPFSQTLHGKTLTTKTIYEKNGYVVQVLRIQEADNNTTIELARPANSILVPEASRQIVNQYGASVTERQADSLIDIYGHSIDTTVIYEVVRRCRAAWQQRHKEPGGMEACI